MDNILLLIIAFITTNDKREGELIFRYIYNYLECEKPFSRLWISSMTETAIREGFASLKDGSLYDSLFLAAEARSKADWMTGINASRALCGRSGDFSHSLGRVQTPVLAMVCRRCLDVRGFRPQPYWQPVITVEKDGGLYHLEAAEHYSDKAEADSVFRRLAAYPAAKVERTGKKDRIIQPPLPHDLASLQKEANKRFGFSAGQTLDIAQKLYEAGLVSYPRTGSRYIPKDLFEKIPALIGSLKEYPGLKSQAKILSVMKLNANCVNDRKITDHHALVVTGNIPGKLTDCEKKVYELAASRMLEAFAGVCIKSVTETVLSCDDIKFNIRQSLVTEEGWTSLFNALPDGEEDRDNGNNAPLPALREGEYLRIASRSLPQKKTRPKALFTDASLLSAMETCGREITDQEARNAVKDCGIGTPATRAAIIETLAERNYIERDGKNIVPTKRGLELYGIVKSMRIADVEMTGEWEKALLKIEKEPDFYISFINGIKVYTRQAVDEIVSMVKAESTTLETPYVCPRCRLGKITLYNKVAKCAYSKCNFTLFRELCGKRLTDKHLTELFKTGRSPLIRGFKSKEGKAFDAEVLFDRNGNMHFDFNKKKGGKLTEEPQEDDNTEPGTEDS